MPRAICRMVKAESLDVDRDTSECRMMMEIDSTAGDGTVETCLF